MSLPKAANLMIHFEFSLREIINATVDKLTAVPGFFPAEARQLNAFFRAHFESGELVEYGHFHAQLKGIDCKRFSLSS